jgi:hypothetical protein
LFLKTPDLILQWAEKLKGVGVGNRQLCLTGWGNSPKQNSSLPWQRAWISEALCRQGSLVTEQLEWYGKLQTIDFWVSQPHCLCRNLHQEHSREETPRGLQPHPNLPQNPIE